MKTTAKKIALEIIAVDSRFCEPSCRFLVSSYPGDRHCGIFGDLLGALPIRHPDCVSAEVLMDSLTANSEIKND